jgi:hypothetical protein
VDNGVSSAFATALVRTEPSVQGIGDELCRHRCAHRPADNTPGEQKRV